MKSRNAFPQQSDLYDLEILYLLSSCRHGFTYTYNMSKFLYSPHFKTGNKEKARKILEKAVCSDVEPLELVQTALRNIVADVYPLYTENDLAAYEGTMLLSNSYVTSFQQHLRCPDYLCI